MSLSGIPTIMEVMLAKWRPLALLVPVLVFMSALRAQPGACPPPNESRFGVVDQLTWAFLYSTDDLEHALRLMNAAGIDWVRLNWAWKDAQREPGPYDFAIYDRVARLASEHDIHLLPILMGVSAWASSAPAELIRERGSMAPVDRYLSTTLDDWLNYVSAVVERYDGDGVDDAPGSPRFDNWEIWNEPNLALFWPPQPDAAEYADFLRVTAEAIRAADPGARVVLGGLAGSGVNAEGTGFLEQLYALGAGPWFDVVSVHLYVHPSQGSAEPLRAALESTRRVMVANGDGDKPLWLTEVGWSTAPNAWGLPTVTEDEVAAWLVEVYSAPLPAEKIFWYNFRDHEPDSDDVEHQFGLVSWDMTPKAAYHAYAAVACHEAPITDG